MKKVIKKIKEMLFGAKEIDLLTADLTVLVKREAKNLKMMATDRELLSLSEVLLDAGNSEHCIYGQMTGNCFNERATQLINACCSGVGMDFYGNERRLKSGPRGGSAYRFSAIESYIATKGLDNDGAGNKALIAYLRGETKKLKI